MLASVTGIAESIRFRPITAPNYSGQGERGGAGRYEPRHQARAGRVSVFVQSPQTNKMHNAFTAVQRGSHMQRFRNAANPFRDMRESREEEINDDKGDGAGECKSRKIIFGVHYASKIISGACACVCV